MSCTAGCPNPGTHQSWGDCLRAKGLRVGSDSYNENKLAKTPGQAMTANQRFHAEMTEYKKARENGLQPEGTQLGQIRQAVRASEATGEAYRADR